MGRRILLLGSIVLLVGGGGLAAQTGEPARPLHFDGEPTAVADPALGLESARTTAFTDRELAPQPAAAQAEAGCPCPCCCCAPCECPCPPAACLPCPRINLINPCWQMLVGGNVTLDMLFNSARPVAPGTPFFLTPDGPFDQDTFDMHARQTSMYSRFWARKWATIAAAA